MQSKTWSRIYNDIVERQHAIAKRRGLGRSGASDGIAVMDDPLAREWQYLKNLAARVACHGGAAWDREKGMRQTIPSPISPAIRRPPHTRRTP